MSFCNYEIHARGKKQAVMMLYAITHSKFAQAILKEYGSEDSYVIWFTGSCESPESLYGREIKNTTIDPNVLTEDEIKSGRKLYDRMAVSIRQKSELLGLELLVRSWSKDDDYDQLEHYKNGYFKGIIGYKYDPAYVTEYDF